MAICIVLIAIYWLRDLDFSGLALFGVRPDTSGEHAEPGEGARLIVLSVLWVLWLYHVLLFGYYAQRDWKDWRSALRSTEERAFPAIGMYFNRAPDDGRTQRKINRKIDSYKWTLKVRRPHAAWVCDYKEHSRPETQRGGFETPFDEYHSVRSRIGWFALVDCGFPALLSLAAIAAGAWAP